MARLIDADALRKGIREAAMESDVSLRDVLTTIDLFPTIDAAPVVRCRECVCCSTSDDQLICSRISEVMDGYYHGTAEVVNLDDYCSRGIRQKAKPIDAKMDGGWQ